jgi:hypothetical protein
VLDIRGDPSKLLEYRCLYIQEVTEQRQHSLKAQSHTIGRAIYYLGVPDYYRRSAV